MKFARTNFLKRPEAIRSRYARDRRVVKRGRYRGLGDEFLVGLNRPGSEHVER